MDLIKTFQEAKQDGLSSVKVGTAPGGTAWLWLDMDANSPEGATWELHAPGFPTGKGKGKASALEALQRWEKSQSKAYDGVQANYGALKLAFDKLRESGSWVSGGRVTPAGRAAYKKVKAAEKAASAEVVKSGAKGGAAMDAMKKAKAAARAQALKEMGKSASDFNELEDRLEAEESAGH